MTRVIALVLALAVTPAATLASPTEPGAVEVVNGDTIRASGRTYRLVGFDTPETGSRARCESERTLGAAASTRLRQLVAGGGLDLEHGRACGILKARGRDVGATLISEGLARPF
jgi:endonuclease YncB( thermonuclease family)